MECFCSRFIMFISSHRLFSNMSRSACGSVLGLYMIPMIEFLEEGLSTSIKTDSNMCGIQILISLRIVKLMLSLMNRPTPPL